MKLKCDNKSELYINFYFYIIFAVIISIYFPSNLLGLALGASCIKIIYQTINTATNIIAYLLGTDPQV